LILALTYSLLFILIIFKSNFFKTELLSSRFVTTLFIFKLTGIFFYILIYSSDLNSLFFNSDSQSIIHDAKIIYNSLHDKPKDFFQIIFGIEQNTTINYLHENYFSKMEKWYLIGKSEFSLNDNQVITKINACLMIFSFGDFYTQSVLTIILSFTGSFLIFNAFVNYFKKKEKLLILILLFIPSVYFWTSGILKEPIVFFSMGLFIWVFFKLFIHNEFSIQRLLLLSLSVFLLIILKPYIIAC